jgi:uncharacterized membrane protein YwaF
MAGTFPSPLPRLRPSFRGVVLIVVDSELDPFTIPPLFFLAFFICHVLVLLHCIYSLIYMKENEIKEK